VTSVLAVERYAVRARALTPIDAARLLPLAAAFSAALSIALVFVKVWLTPHFAHASVVVGSALSAVVTSLIGAMLLRRWSQSLPRAVSAGGVTSWLLAIELGVVLLPVPVLLLAKSVPEEDVTGWLWPLVNKRWVVALYNIAVVTFLLFPVAIERWRSRFGSSIGMVDRPRREIGRRSLVSTAGCVPVLALCWYLAGPPWHLERNHDSVEWHEQMHFGGLQAIDKGFLPDIGQIGRASCRERV